MYAWTSVTSYMYSSLENINASNPSKPLNVGSTISHEITVKEHLTLFGVYVLVVFETKNEP